MSCRCTDINKMEQECRMLQQVRELAEQIMAKNTDIEAALRETAAALPDTLIIPEDKTGIIMEELNEDSVKAMNSMMQHIDVAFDKLMQKLEEAYVEDEKFHHRKKKRYIEISAKYTAATDMIVKELQ